MTQNQQVLEHLRRFKGITSIEAINRYGITRLSARIDDLRHEGYIIGSETVKYKKTNGKMASYSRYTLLEDKK